MFENEICIIPHDLEQQESLEYIFVDCHLRYDLKCFQDIKYTKRNLDEILNNLNHIKELFKNYDNFYLCNYSCTSYTNEFHIELWGSRKETEQEKNIRLKNLCEMKKIIENFKSFITPELFVKKYGIKIYNAKYTQYENLKRSFFNFPGISIYGSHFDWYCKQYWEESEKSENTLDKEMEKG